MSSLLERLERLRRDYGAVRDALPWLDASRWDDEPPAFDAHAATPRIPCVRREPLGLAAAGGLDASEPHLLLYEPDAVPDPDTLLAAMESRRMPLVVLHTDVEARLIGRWAGRHPDMPFIVESGPRKILYLLEELKRLMLAHPNVYLSTYNVCNWLGLERLCKAGLWERLLFGTHTPRYSPDAAMAPIVMGQMGWSRKCDIAGNNLRRLLSLPPCTPPEVPFHVPEPFITDAHAHSLKRGSEGYLGFPTPDLHFDAGDWLRQMDACAIERMLLVPTEALFDPQQDARACAEHLLAAAPRRFRYVVTFHPGGDGEHSRRVVGALRDPACAGIKIHPSLHGVAADDAAFGRAFELAAEHGKPIVTHSWEVSDYNPSQELSHPDRFRTHLAAFPHVRLVLGHAGGRPSALDAVVALCREFPRVCVDLSGDYFDNGLVECLAARVGVERIVYGSDVDWIDPRCTLGPVLASRLSGEDVLAILRSNAARVYGSAAR